ncbi:hypothetical protein [Vibrio parahaemolyticus]|uniref:hypothetical protein n=1 Tax=Vibrio parahaemolyticus TaxID=670 RepID=UPI0017813288|nr:hypothetical protein [Vibrio parahaemolyticus]MBD6944391.1 hypothetical protein [Vibrio parahaemolyticus]MBD6978928.1 hypothetical protein [Vibrio parahaemolyticus]MBD6990991.1 hypothetical protein [Vibrio parahaemolyticus]WOZ62894.1 hypothetical protein RHS38_26115 [Vibrio parahaemolyticus]WOZ62918.1 hypothetical protein RHS38_26535 [Vibrio parahaemolyticus]
MKKVLLLTAAFMLPTLLTACNDSSNQEETKMERCTELRKIADLGGMGKVSKQEYSDALDEWEKLKCTPSDIIQG